MAFRLREQFDPEEYLWLENRSPVKHEYDGGNILLMAGASPRHDDIVGSVFASLHQQLRGNACRVYTSDVRVRVSPTSYTYPDVKVVCGEAQWDEGNPPSLLNPTVIIEVASPSTQDYDLGRKFPQAIQLPSLRDYIVVMQDSLQVLHYQREQGNAWKLFDWQDPAQTIPLPAIGCTLLLADIYERVDFSKPNGA